MSRALFISDLHLSVERPGPNEQFFRFLHEEAARADALYILGDLFEYWIGDDGIKGDALGRQVVRALRVLSKAGVAVCLMVGNRDFLLGAKFCAESGARFLDDPRVVEIDGKRVLLMHGDTLCTDDADYQGWRATARSAAWQQEFLAKSLPERRQTIGALRAKSKAVVQAKPAEIMDVNAVAVREAFRVHGVQLMIHGHTHRAAKHEHEVDGRLCRRWVLPDWYGRGGYLALDAVGPRLVSF
ncbi:MAG: UDP-2,3-diacylglucosamine diphosphatase [Betaproteobacteria bacterium]|nr:UDP-2,3-diacylglucosamine diphosphatase [Betaproteobacteria bacterium]